MSLPVLPVYKAMATLLEVATGKPVGRGKLPKIHVNGKPTDEADIPCTVLYVERSLTSGPGWGDADADAEMRFRARVVSREPTQVEWLTDRIRGAWLDRGDDHKTYRVEFSVDGMSVMDRSVDSESPIDPENDAVFSRSLVLCARMTPADTPG